MQSLKAFLAVGILTGSSLVAGPSRAQSPGDISDFMTMDVCVGSNGAIIAAVPGDAACKSHRNVKVGEMPPYQLENFGPPKAACKAGPVSKVNIPVEKNGNTRIISSTVHTAGCGGASGDDTPDGQGGASIQWHDDGYGFIMGSWSPVALSAFESSLCAQNSGNSKRFFRGWVIGPSKVPAVGGSGYGAFGSKMRNGETAMRGNACAEKYTHALTTWSVQPVTYKSGRDFVSIISSHYAQGAPDGKSPGNALQMEQTYWTREFGLSRWEKWARDDWDNPKSKLSALELGQRLYARGRCSPTAYQAVKFNDQLQVSARNDVPGVYARTISNPATGEKHTWYLTLCEDYTNAQSVGGKADAAASIAALADDAYWR